MAEQFSASTAFTNMNNNTDGWGDDWGDWNDNSGPAVETTMPKTVGSMQTAPNAPPNTYFQPPQQPQPQQPQQHLQTQYQQPQPQMTPAPGTYLTGGQNRMDQHNHNYVPNYSQGNTGYQQPTMMPPTTANQYSTANYAQPSYDAPATNFFNAPPSHPAPAVPHPPASTTPQLIPTFSQTISDSFDTTASNNSWNWTVPEPPKHSQPTSGPKPQPNENVAPKQSPQQQQSAPVQQYEDFPQQGNLPSAASVQLQRLKAETLSPQWSIESQVSSSDRSLESDPSGDNRGPAQTTTTMRASEAPTSLPAAVPDKLDEVLEALSIKQEPTESTAVAGNSQLESNYRGEQNFPPPPPSIVGTAAAAGPIVNDSLSLTSKTSSTTPPLPPPPIDNPTIASSPASGPPMASGGPPPKAMQIAGSNPFKRTGPRSHTATPGLSGAGASPAAVVPPSTNAGGAFFYQQQTQHPALLQPASVEEQHNIESLTPENQEILVETRSSEQTMENQEIAPNNDRNQYLQTGHLSEDGYGVEGTTSMSGNSRTLQATGSDEVETNHGDANDGRLPPPGLSRYVPGQNEQQPEPFVASSVAVGQSFPSHRRDWIEWFRNVSDLSLERQADGEVSDSTTPAAPPTIMPAASMAGPGARNDHLHHHHHHNHLHERRVDMSDRNLYRVPGEDDNHTHLNQQRVVPGGGTENDRPMPAPASSAVPVSSAASVMLNSVASLDMPEEQRELVMDGENPDDRREDSLVGGNADPIPSAAGAGSSAAVAASGAAALETESNVTVDSTYRMEPSNTSTADESDKGGFYGGAAGSSKGGRREDDNLRRSNKSKSSRDRYDTEDSDYSEHERRRRDRVAESSSSQRQERSRRTNGDREKDKQRKDNGRDRDRDRDRERDRDRDRDRDYYYRDRDRERNRYDRDRGERYGRNSKYDRDSRYETDGSKYETERSTRYEKEDRRYGSSTTRDDYYRKRDERGPTDDSRG
uniref:Uncharacterized protein n=1 Tax=Anopheles stephensi TaxID=30069 RepID=A0A182YEA7_ANOST